MALRSMIFQFGISLVRISDFEGCNGQPPFPANFFNGAVALIRRGNCTFTEKITNAFNAGAALVVIRNNQPGTVNMDTTGQPNVPAYSCDQTPGDALAAFVDANPTNATVNFTLHGVVSSQADVLADFSLRGPVPAPYQDIQKPDITDPGVIIYAAFPIDLGAYGTISGTSMSTPHNSGSAALVRAVHADWTVLEVRSAMMMTSFNGGTKEDGTTPWDADDVGTGRVDLTKAALAGLVMDETTQHFIDANPNTGGDPKTLNIPSVRNMECSPNCTWTRTVRNTLTSATSWTATGTAITPGFTVDVQPSSFSFTGGLGETQELTITVTPETNLTSAVAFGEVVLHRGPMPTDRMASPSPMRVSPWRSKARTAAAAPQRRHQHLAEAVHQPLRNLRVRTLQRATRWRAPVTTALLQPRTITGALLT